MDNKVICDKCYAAPCFCEETVDPQIDKLMKKADELAKQITKLEQEQMNNLYVEIHLDASSEPIKYDTAIAVFQKGDMICVSFKKGENEVYTDKYPIMNIFRVRNTYTGKHLTN